MLVTNTLEGRYNPQFAQFVAKNYTDMRDVKDLNVHEGDSAEATREIGEELEALEKEMREWIDQH
jgi:hypothetical protein